MSFFVINEPIAADEDCQRLADALACPDMKRSPYDLAVLKERAELWRAEAAAATLEAMRSFCLTEAAHCERRVEMSLSTPVIREMFDHHGTRARAR